MSSRALLALALLAGAPQTAHAQGSGVRDSLAPSPPLFVNDEAERYLRVQQVVGDAPLLPWTIRGLTATQRLLLANASAGDMRLHASTLTLGPARFSAIPLTASVVFNSAFAYGMNDGPVWAGRGLTTSVSGGLAMSSGPLHVTLSPTLFRAENRRFPLRDNGQVGPYAFGDGFDAFSIDQPQRFGDSPYQRATWGNSGVELAARGVTMGLSHAVQHWGPARDHPLILGNNASGFPHVFLGTAMPVNLWVAKAHARMIWGRLDASPYTPMRVEQRYRMAVGLATVVTPRGLDGLELGFARFFHIPWADGVVNVDNLLRPFIGIVRDFRIRPSGNAIGDELDNQIASVFGRWTHPASGFEVYGEYAREDYNKDFRDLALEPDHIGAYLLGVQRVMRRADSGYAILRAEVLNSRISPLVTSREQSRYYTHSRIRHGHTHEGQVLGSAGGFGGGAAVVAMDRYSRWGRWTVTAARTMRAEFRQLPTNVPVPRRSDVFQELGVNGEFFFGSGGRRLAATWELAGVYEIARDFADDAFNARLGTGVRYAW